MEFKGKVIVHSLLQINDEQSISYSVLRSKVFDGF